MRRFALTVLAAVVALTVAAPVAQAAPSPDYQPPPVAWGPCPKAPLAGRAECGFVTVPLDYARPGGEKIKLAVSRVRHKVADAKYQGVMLVNPGGPGGAGRWLCPCSAAACPSTRATPTTGSASTRAASAPASPR